MAHVVILPQFALHVVVEAFPRLGVATQQHRRQHQALGVGALRAHVMGDVFPPAAVARLDDDGVSGHRGRLAGRVADRTARRSAAAPARIVGIARNPDILHVEGEFADFDA